MKPKSARSSSLRSFVVAAAFFAAPLQFAFAQVPFAPADPWPRTIQRSNAATIIYQPPVEAWEGNQI